MASGNQGSDIKNISKTINKSRDLSKITVPIKLVVFISEFLDIEKAFNNSPSLKTSTPLPKYPIIVADNDLLIEIDPKGSMRIFHLIALI